MKQKSNRDEQKVSELLKKLQASYLGSTGRSAAKKKQEDADEDDRKFREQLASMLNKASKSSKPAKKAKSEPKLEEKPPEVITEGPEDLPKSDSIAEAAPIPTPPAEPQEKAVAETIETTESSTLPTSPQKEKKKGEKKAKKAKLSPLETLKTVTEEPPTEISEITEPTAEWGSAEIKAIESESPAVDGSDKPSAVEVKTIETPIEAVTVEAQEEPPPHPLNKVVPLPTQTVEEPKSAPKKVFILQKQEPTVKIESSMTLDKQSVSNVKRRHAVTKEPASKAPDLAKSKNAASEPIVIRPKIQAVQKEAPAVEPSIVIRPSVQKATETESIVIRPRASGKTAPTPQTVRENLAAQPIKIGKEILPDGKKKEIPNRSEKPKPIMKKEQNTTIVPPTSSPKAPPQKSTTRVIAKGPAAPSKKPGVTIARSSASEKSGSDAKSEPPKKESTPKSTAKKSGVTLPHASEKKRHIAEARSAKKKPISDEDLPPIPDDEDLEEVLDEDIVEEIPLDEPEEIPAEQQKLSPFQRRQQEKQRKAEESLSALELIRKKSGLSEDDIVMMFELGYENELGRLVGYENLKRLKSEHLKTIGRKDRKHYRTAYGYRGEEYADSEQRESITAAYVYDRKKLILRTLLTALAALLLFFIDIPQLIGTRLTNIDAAYPFLLPILGMLLLTGTAALSYKQLNAGLRSFLKFTPTPYSLCAILTPIALLYDVFSLFSQAEILRVNFIVALSLLLTAICDVLRLSNELRTFRIISAEGQKTVLAPALPRKKKLRQGEKIVKIINDDLGENLYQVRECTQTTGFFRRFNDMSAAARPFTVFIIIMLSLATLSAFANAVYTSSVSSALSAFMSVLLVCAPLSALFGFFYPLCCANRLLARRNCTLVGEESVQEYTEKKTVIFRDSDLYTAEKRTEISIREGDIFRNDLRLAGTLFRKLNGTLEGIGDSLPKGKEELPISIVRIQESGVEAIVDNRYHLLAGNAEFLQRGGVRVPKESTDRVLRRTANVALMYIAVDGVLKLSYEIEYKTRDSFEELIRELADSDTAVAISSYDPNLNETFLQKSRPDENDPVRVIKPGRFEEEKPLEIADAGAVALGGKSDIAYPLYAVAGIGRLRRFGSRIQLIASLIGGAAVTVLTLLGFGNVIGVLPIVGYQLFWVLVSGIAAHSELNSEKLRFH